MPAVLGKIVKPDLTQRNNATVTYFLVDQFGAPVQEAWTLANETVVCEQSVPLAADGSYTFTVTDNASINPANTRWRRQISYQGGQVFSRDLVVPTGGGPYQEQAIAQGVSALPNPTPSNEIASMTLGATTGDLAVTGFTNVMVPTMIVTIGDRSTPTLFLCSVTVQHQTVASALLMCALTTAGDTNIGNAKGTAQEYGGPAASPTTLSFLARIPAHTPGSYQIAVNGASGNLRVVGGTNGITTVEVLGV